jgi:hypothetical protein
LIPVSVGLVRICSEQSLVVVEFGHNPAVGFLVHGHFCEECDHRILARYAGPHSQHASKVPVEPLDPVGGVDHRPHARVVAQIGERVHVVPVVRQTAEVAVASVPPPAHGLPAVHPLFTSIVRVIHAEYSGQITSQCGLVEGPDPGQQSPLDVDHAALHAYGGESFGQFRCQAGQTVGDEQVHLTQAPLGQPVHQDPPSGRALGGHVEDVEDFPAAVRRDGQHHVERLLGHGRPAHLHADRVDEHDRIARRQRPLQPPLHVLAHPCEHTPDRCRAVMVAVELLEDGTELVLGQALGAQAGHEPVDLALLIAQQGQDPRIELPVAVARDAQLQDPALSVGPPGTEPVGLVGRWLAEQMLAALVAHQSVQDPLHHIVEATFAAQMVADQGAQLYFGEFHGWVSFVGLGWCLELLNLNTLRGDPSFFTR